MIINLFITILTAYSFAVPESESFEVTKDLFSKKNLWITPKRIKSTINDKEGSPIFLNYFEATRAKAIFPDSTLKKRGTVVILPGRTEFSLKYIELAYDLLSRGYQKVLLLDHRGQGLSGRLLPNRNKGHVENFDDYAVDLKTLLESLKSKEPIYLIAHSMGAAIATRYLQITSYKAQKPVHKAILSAPMYEFFLPKPYNEKMVHFFANDACNSWSFFTWLTGAKCYGYVSKEKQNYKLSQDQFSAASNTSSKTRFKNRQWLEEQYKELGVKVGGTTTRWILASLNAFQKIRDQKLLRKINTPVMILTAHKDTQIPRGQHTEVCKSIPHCKLQDFPESRHEILIENDPIRDRALKLIINFLKE